LVTPTSAAREPIVITEQARRALDQVAANYTSQAERLAATVASAAWSEIAANLDAASRRIAATFAAATRPALSRAAADLNAQSERTAATVASSAWSEIAANFDAESRRIAATFAAATRPALSRAAADLNAQSERIAATVASSAWSQIAANLDKQSEHIASMLVDLSILTDVASTAVSVMTQAALIANAADAPGDELECYSISPLLDPAAQRPIQLGMSIVVFVSAFSWVVQNFDTASDMNNFFGAGPLLYAQIAWSLTGLLLKRLSADQ
jgi:hypothetical protein